MAVKIRDAGVQSENFLSSPFEAELAPFLLSCRLLELLNELVAARRGDDLDVLHGVEHGGLPNRRTRAPKRIRVHDLWHLILAEEAHEQRPGCLGIAVFLKEKVQHVPVFVHRSPHPLFDPADLDASLVQMPPGAQASPLGGAVLR